MTSTGISGVFFFYYFYFFTFKTNLRVCNPIFGYFYESWRYTSACVRACMCVCVCMRVCVCVWVWVCTVTLDDVIKVRSAPDSGLGGGNKYISLRIIPEYHLSCLRMYLCACMYKMSMYTCAVCVFCVNVNIIDFGSRPSFFWTTSSILIRRFGERDVAGT
jgi:hypothetical protein